MKKWSKSEATAWLKEHDFKSGDYDKMPNWHSFRQSDPGKYDRFTNKMAADGVMFILGWKENTSEVQSVRFYHGEEDSQRATTGFENVKSLIRYKDTFTHQGLPGTITIKDIDLKTGTVQFYASTFDVIDDGNEVVRAGAFQRTIQERGPKGSNRIAHLRQHRIDYLLAKPHILVEKEFGLFVESKILPTSYGRDTLILYDGGAINEHSIGYDVVQERHEEEQPRDLLELRLWDISTVVWGMNPVTPFVGIKSIDDFTRAQGQMEAMNRVLTREITDDTAFQLEYALRQMEQGMIDFLKGYVVVGSGRPASDSQYEVSHREIVGLLKSQTSDIERFIKLRKE